jgi:hypothetical protein
LPTEEYDFVQKHIGIINNDELITMDNWVGEKTKSKESDLLLQMDIEGFEYQALLNISDTLLKRFRIMVIEFHYLNEFWNPRFFEIAKAVFEKILNSHACVHIHPNNCCGVNKRFGMEIPSVAEFTFYRKDKISSLVYETKFPNPLDFDNTNKKSIFLPKIWYSNN